MMGTKQTDVLACDCSNYECTVAVVWLSLCDALSLRFFILSVSVHMHIFIYCRPTVWRITYINCYPKRF